MIYFSIRFLCFVRNRIELYILAFRKLTGKCVFAYQTWAEHFGTNFQMHESFRHFQFRSKVMPNFALNYYAFDFEQAQRTNRKLLIKSTLIYIIRLNLPV